MGCGGSKSTATGGSFCAVASGSPPVELVAREVTTVLDVSIARSGLLSSSTQAQTTSKNPSALFQHVQQASSEQLEVAACVQKMEVPESPTMGQAVGAAVGGGMNMEVKSTLHTFFRRVPAGTTIDTVQVYTPFTSQVNWSAMDLFKSGIDLGTSQEGMTGEIHRQLGLGFRLVGLNFVGGSSSMQAGIGSAQGGSQAIAELVFQKTGDAAREGALASSAMKLQVNMGQMTCTPPDFLPYLNKMGAEGYSLSGISQLPAPAQAPPVGAMSFTMEMPVLVMMERTEDRNIDKSTFKFVTTTHHYTMKMSGFKMSIDGDIVPLVEAYARSGWVVKAALSLPAEMKPMSTKMTMPVLFFFESEVGGSSGAGEANPNMAAEANPNMAAESGR